MPIYKLAKTRLRKTESNFEMIFYYVKFELRSDLKILDWAKSLIINKKDRSFIICIDKKHISLLKRFGEWILSFLRSELKTRISTILNDITAIWQDFSTLQSVSDRV